MKLLLTTFSLCPGEGSEPGVGWHTVVELAREHEVHALVDRNGEAKVRARFDAAAHPRIHLHFVGLPFVSSLVGKSTSTGLWLIYYYLWQFAAFVIARRLHLEHRFDGAQHVTFVKYNVPSLLGFVARPFVFGPVGGAERAPMCFFHEFGWKVRFAEGARIALQKLASFDPLLRGCVHRSAIALGVTRETTQALLDLGAANAETWPAVTLADDDIARIDAACSLRAAQRTGPCTLLYVGRLLAWKGMHLGLRALAQSNAQDLRLRIIGDGPQRAALEAEAHTLGIAERVEFSGALPRERVLQAYASADGFLYPSLHDSGGNAVLEAMCASLPILCLRFGGPNAIVTEDCGWKIAAMTPSQAVEGLANSINSFAMDASERAKRGAAARQHCLDGTHGFRISDAGEDLCSLWRQLASS